MRKHALSDKTYPDAKKRRVSKNSDWKSNTLALVQNDTLCDITFCIPKINEDLDFIHKTNVNNDCDSNAMKSNNQQNSTNKKKQQNSDILQLDESNEYSSVLHGY